MPQPIAAFTADNHLRPTTWTKHPDLHSDAFVSWHQIIDHCVAAKLPLIQLGDLFDSERPDSLSVGHYLHGVHKLREAGVAFYYIEGNHDRADPPWASLTPYAVPLGQTAIAGVPFYGISYRRADELPDALAAVPPATRVLLCHQSWREIQRVGDCQGTFGQIPHGLVLLSGDYHVCETYTGTAMNGEKVTAYSPGSTAMQDLAEWPLKFFGILHDDLSVVWKQIDTRPYVEHTCDSEENMAELIGRMAGLYNNHERRLHPDIQKPILRIKYDSSIPEAYDRLTAAAGTMYHLFLEPRHKVNNQVVDVVALPAAATQTLRAALRTLSPSEAVYQAAIRLMDTTDLKAEIEAMFNEQKAAEQLAP